MTYEMRVKNAILGEFGEVGEKSLKNKRRSLRVIKKKRRYNYFIFFTKISL